MGARKLINLGPSYRAVDAAIATGVVRPVAGPSAWPARPSFVGVAVALISGLVLLVVSAQRHVE